jgi:hypothetical protein
VFRLLATTLSPLGLTFFNSMLALLSHTPYLMTI